MNIHELIHWQMLAFFLLGQNSYNPLFCSTNHCFSALRFTPTLVVLMLASSMSIFAITYQVLYVISYDGLDSIVGSLFIFCGLIARITAIVQSFFFYKELIDLLDTFRAIDHYIRHKFFLQIDFRDFVKRYLVKVFGSVLLFINGRFEDTTLIPSIK